MFYVEVEFGVFFWTKHENLFSFSENEAYTGLQINSRAVLTVELTEVGVKHSYGLCTLIWERGYNELVSKFK